jgi:HK97 family phage major capsid protein
VIRTETGAEMPWPTANDTSNEGGIVGENVAAGNQDPAFDLLKWGAYKYTSDIIKIPAELLEDSAFDLASEVGRMCGERIARRQNRDFTVGDGAGKASGIVTGVARRHRRGATAITADEIVGLIHSVDPAYRATAKLMFHDNTLLGHPQAQGQPGSLPVPGRGRRRPADDLGRPYTINQHMARRSRRAKTVVYGQLDKYKIRDVRTIRMRRLVERYADADQEGFVAFLRSDGNLLDAGVAR